MQEFLIRENVYPEKLVTRYFGGLTKFTGRGLYTILQRGTDQNENYFKGDIGDVKIILKFVKFIISTPICTLGVPMKLDSFSFVKSKIPSCDRIFGVDPAGLAPASSGANADMLLHTLQARIHRGILKQKEFLSQGIPFVAPNFGLWYTDHISVVFPL